MFVDAWGGIRKEYLAEGEKMILDNYQMVAMTATADYTIRKHGNLKTTLFGGEALVIEITGPGTVYFQTKEPDGVCQGARPVHARQGRRLLRIYARIPGFSAFVHRRARGTATARSSIGRMDQRALRARTTCHAGPGEPARRV